MLTIDCRYRTVSLKRKVNTRALCTSLHMALVSLPKYKFNFPRLNVTQYTAATLKYLQPRPTTISHRTRP